MSEDEITRRFKDIENRNPIFAGRFHTNIAAVYRCPYKLSIEEIKRSGTNFHNILCLELSERREYNNDRS